MSNPTIEFSAINKTPGGLRCHYWGTRIGACGTKLHCFSVWHPDLGAFEHCFDDQGRRLSWVDHKRKYLLDGRFAPIVAQPLVAGSDA